MGESRYSDRRAGEAEVYARGADGKKLDGVATRLTVARCAARKHNAHIIDGAVMSAVGSCGEKVGEGWSDNCRWRVLRDWSRERQNAGRAWLTNHGVCHNPAS
jgi:hypothetical protein